MGVLERAQRLLHWCARSASRFLRCARGRKNPYFLLLWLAHQKKFFLSCRLHDTILVSLLKSSCCGEKLRIRSAAHSQDLRSRRSRNRGVQNTCSNWQRYRKMVFDFSRFCWVCRIIWKYCRFGTTLTVSSCVLNWSKINQGGREIFISTVAATGSPSVSAFSSLFLLFVL